MVRVLRDIVFVVVAMLLLTGCFKKVTTDTTLRIEVLSASVSGGGRVAAEGCYGYIYYADGDWTVASYEDAVAKSITNIATGEKRSEPDGESEPYLIEGSSNDYISIFQDEPSALIVVVYPEAKMYAYMYRQTTAENLHYTYLTLIFHRWKSANYTEGNKDGYKWEVVVPEAPATPPTNNENE
jgi:hypothetical protein